MNILMVTTQLGHGYVQGAERYVQTLGKELSQRGHEMEYMAGDPHRRHPAQPVGMEAGETPRTSSLGPSFRCPTRGWMSVRGIGGRRMRDWLSHFHPDLVHVNNAAHIGIGVTDACRRLSIPYVVTVHDYWWICPKETLLRDDGSVCDGTPGWRECLRCISATHERTWPRRLAKWPPVLAPLVLGAYYARAVGRGMTPADLRRWTRRRQILLNALNAAGHVIFPSGAMADVIGSRLDHRRWSVIPNGLAAGWFANPRPVPATPRPADELVLGFAGALRSHKAPHLLLDAVRRLGWLRTRVLLAGGADDPVYWRGLQAQAAGLNVAFLGRLEPERMPAFLRGLDVLAVTSVWPENYPYAVLEALAAGVPVVASRIGGMVDQVADAGLLFEPRSVEGLARALVYAREHPDAGRAATVPTAEQMTDATEAVYRAVVEE